MSTRWTIARLNHKFQMKTKKKYFEKFNIFLGSIATAKLDAWSESEQNSESSDREEIDLDRQLGRPIQKRKPICQDVSQLFRLFEMRIYVSERWLARFRKKINLFAEKLCYESDAFELGSVMFKRSALFLWFIPLSNRACPILSRISQKLFKDQKKRLLRKNRHENMNIDQLSLPRRKRVGNKNFTKSEAG